MISPATETFLARDFMVTQIKMRRKLRILIGRLSSKKHRLMPSTWTKLPRHDRVP